MIISKLGSIICTKEETEDLAMRDILFAPESVSLEPNGKSLTVRQKPEPEKHFNSKRFISIPCWNYDEYLDYEGVSCHGII